MTSREITAAALLFSAIWAPVAYKALTPDAIAAEPGLPTACQGFVLPTEVRVSKWIDEQRGTGRDKIISVSDNFLCAW